MAIVSYSSWEHDVPYINIIKGNSIDNTILCPYQKQKQK